MIALLDAVPFMSAVLISGAIAAVAWRVRSLSVSGAAAAVAVGTLALMASWGNGALLFAWFALAALLSKLGKRRKAQRVREIVEKSDARDAQQVMANGLVFALASAGIIFVGAQSSSTFGLAVVASPDGAARWRLLCSIAAAAALAAAGADTWATEIGTLYGRAPWSLRTRSRVPTGTSGAITFVGTVAMLAGASVIASLASVLAVPGDSSNRSGITVAIFAGGAIGAFSDTVIGAWVQQRRWCPRCGVETEQRSHTCGTTTGVSAGVIFIDNDVVNFLCTVIGATLAVGIFVSGIFA